jgi:hypothetical protein
VIVSGEAVSRDVAENWEDEAWRRCMHELEADEGLLC